jgi:hypothetical protein
MVSATRTKEGHAMKYASTFFAVLLVAGWFSVPALYADGGSGDARRGQPVEEQTGEVLTAEGGGGDRGGQPMDDAHDIRLV